ncbi:MAG: chorismate mutase [Sphingomonadaceae bacterium]|nr:chorismate mutase [Sphingomonadaceae bacterium]
MSDKPLAPDDCHSMHEVRAGVDALDAELVALLSRRFAYMRAAARIKPEREQVRDEARKAAVIARAAQLAEEMGLPRDMVESIWEELVEGSIAYELAAWKKAHKSD